MNLMNIIKVAMFSLGKNKMRSFLTMLGIVIGVSAVIAMLAVGQGAREAIQTQIQKLGTNMIIIFPSSVFQGGVSSGAGTSVKLTAADARAITAECPSVEYVSPTIRTSAQVIYKNLNWRTQIQGGNTSYFHIRNWSLKQGNYFSENDIKSSANVCVIGQTVVQNLFGNNVSPIGKLIRVNNLPFKVIGILQSKGQTAMGNDQDDIIIAPFTTVQKKILGWTWVNVILASARSSGSINDAEQQITEVLRARHHLQPWQQNDFTVRTQTDIATTAESTSRVLTILLASIASVSLFVGGIGIMNIMLVSVTERTREIGIRMSIGARGKDILYQFLIEAIVLSLFGGIIGVILGVVASDLISSLAGWATLISAQSIILSFGFAGAVGIFFGFYPARKAALLNPIDALRFE